MTSLLKSGSRVVRATRAACTVRRRHYAAEQLLEGMLIRDPDGRLGLHADQVRVTDAPRSPDRSNTTDVVVDWEIPGTNITGRLSIGRLVPVWVAGGAL